MSHWKVAGGLAALFAAGILGSQLPSVAQGGKKKPVDSPVGFVDLGRVTDQIKKTPTWQVETKKFEDERNRLQDEIANLTKIRYLTDAEKVELSNLRAKSKPTDAEKAKIGELEGRSEKLDKDFQMLASVEKPTPEQDARIKEIAKIREQAIGKLQDEAEQRSLKLREMEGKVLEAMQDKIIQIVSDISENKNVTMVMDRQAVLYGGQDLTEDVLKKLGAK
jgi:outer membrane protein